MKITKKLLQEKGACPEGIEWFERKFPDGWDYIEVLNALAEENLNDWASWALNALGKIDKTLEVEGDLISEKSIFFPGNIKVHASLETKFSIKAGGNIEAGGSLEAGG